MIVVVYYQRMKEMTVVHSVIMMKEVGILLYYTYLLLNDPVTLPGHEGGTNLIVLYLLTA